MRLTYDAEADALYIQLRDCDVSHGVDIEEGVLADMGEDGHVVGFEVLDAAKRIGAAELASIGVEDLVSGRVEILSLTGTSKTAKKAPRKAS